MEKTKTSRIAIVMGKEIPAAEILFQEMDHLLSRTEGDITLVSTKDMVRDYAEKRGYWYERKTEIEKVYAVVLVYPESDKEPDLMATARKLADDNKKVVKKIVFNLQEEKKPPVKETKPTLPAKGVQDRFYAYTDGSWTSRHFGRYGAAYVLVRLHGGGAEIVGEWKRGGENPELATARNVAGEVAAVVAAMRWAVKKQQPLTICHDYEGLAKWVDGTWKAKSPVAKLMVAEHEKAKNWVRFKKVPAHSGNQYNERADKLAKAAIEEMVNA